MTESRAGGIAQTVAPTTPDREKYILEADALRRRQLASALVHGTQRSWRERRRVWPSAVAGVVAIALVIAALCVYSAFQTQQANERRQEQQRNQSLNTAPAVPGQPAPAPPGGPG